MELQYRDTETLTWWPANVTGNWRIVQVDNDSELFLEIKVKEIEYSLENKVEKIKKGIIERFFQWIVNGDFSKYGQIHIEHTISNIVDKNKYVSEKYLRLYEEYDNKCGGRNE